MHTIKGKKSKQVGLLNNILEILEIPNKEVIIQGKCLIAMLPWLEKWLARQPFVQSLHVWLPKSLEVIWNTTGNEWGQKWLHPQSLLTKRPQRLPLASLGFLFFILLINNCGPPLGLEWTWTSTAPMHGPPKHQGRSWGREFSLGACNGVEHPRSFQEISVPSHRDVCKLLEIKLWSNHLGLWKSHHLV